MECLAICFIFVMILFFAAVIGGTSWVGVSTIKAARDLKLPDGFPSSDGNTLLVDGYVADFIDGTPRPLTPEEQVRQFVLQVLITMGFKKSQIAVEFPVKMGSSTKFADIAIFQPDQTHHIENVWMIVECKRTSVIDSTEGVAQLKSYMAACLNCQWGMWTNSQSKVIYKKVFKNNRLQWESHRDLPKDF